jgi:hypothetical protein
LTRGNDAPWSSWLFCPKDLDEQSTGTAVVPPFLEEAIGNLAMLSHYLAITVALGAVSAHGDAAAELSARTRFLATHANNLDHCAKRHSEMGLDERAVQRRAKFVRDLTGKDLFHGMSAASATTK